MTPIQDSVLSHLDAAVEGRWRVRVRNRETGEVVEERRIKNVWTTTGLTALATAIYGGYVPPIYLVMENFYSTPMLAVSAGATQIQFSVKLDQAGDTQLVLGAGLASQEVVTFSSVTSSAPYIYTLSTACVNAHPTTDPCVRQPTVNDTMSLVTSELIFDQVNFYNQRPTSPGGYSGGPGNGTIQFFIAGPAAQGMMMTLGLSDSITPGTGNLHNHFVLGYNHNNPLNDLEIDGSLTLTNG